MSMLTNALRIAAAVGIAVGAVAAPVNAQQPDATRTYHRQLKVYYGTWTVFIQGSPTAISSQTIVQLSDHISDGIRLHIQADVSVDARVKSALPLWVYPPNLTNIEWVLGTPENLPAVANFNAAIAALGGSIAADSGFLTPFDKTYLLDSFLTTETAPVTCGDPDGMVCGEEGQVVTVENNFAADVSYIERNGSVTLSAVNKCPLSHGYWKNNLNLWSVSSLTLGTLSYTKSALVAILNNQSTKDASVILGRQLIAAKLNVLYGSDPTPVATVISQSDALIGANLVPFGVPPNSALGKAMTARTRTLTDYNNGLLTTICVP